MYKMKLIRLSLLLGFLLLSSCDFSLPMQGLKHKEIKDQGYAFAVMTYAKLGNDKDKNTDFWRHTNIIRSDLKKLKGVLGYKYKRNIFTGTTYSYILFKDRSSIIKLGNLPSHRSAVAKNRGALVKTNIKIIKIDADDYDMPWQDIVKSLN
jgi:hypothetical protein